MLDAIIFKSSGTHSLHLSSTLAQHTPATTRRDFTLCVCLSLVVRRRRGRGRRERERERRATVNWRQQEQRCAWWFETTPESSFQLKKMSPLGYLLKSLNFRVESLRFECMESSRGGFSEQFSNAESCPFSLAPFSQLSSIRTTGPESSMSSSV